MPFAIQFINRPGLYHGGYVINDGTHTTFVSTGGEGNTFPLYEWLGNGDKGIGRDIARGEGCFSIPSVILNPAQYNSLIASIEDSKVIAFKG